MVTTIQQSLRPLFVTCFIMGLYLYSTKQTKPKIRWITYLSLLYFLIYWFSYGYFLCYIHSNTLARDVLTFHDSIYNYNGIEVFITIISVIMCLYHQKRFEIFLKRLTAINNTLEELGTPKMYQKMYIWSIRIVISWFLYLVIINCCNTWVLRTSDITSRKFFLIISVHSHCYHVNTFMDLLFIFLLWYIGTRFDKVNEHLQSLLMKGKHGLKCTRKKPVIMHQYFLHINNYKQTLWTSMQLHLELCRIARNLNFMFQVQLTFKMTFSCVYITVLCCIICIYLIFGQDVATVHEWVEIVYSVFIYLMRFCSINYIYENIILKANNVNKIIHQLTDILRYTDVWKEIHQFTLQVMQHPLKFSGMGLFYFGYKTFWKVCLTITSRIVPLYFQAKVILANYVLKEKQD